MEEQCPLRTTDAEAVVTQLRSLSLNELITLTEQLTGALSSSEQLSYNVNQFCSEYSDHNGRIRFVTALVENGLVDSVFVPLSFMRNPEMLTFIRPPVFDFYVPIAHETESTAAALTDDIIEAVTNLTVSNPRWVHTNQERKEASPQIAAVGDTIELMVDVSGYPEGAPVVFDIFDASTDPAMRIETERGKNEKGTAKITWKVSDPNENGSKLKLHFEGSARSKSSGIAPINLLTLYKVEVRDKNDKLVEGVKVEFDVTGTKTVVMTNTQGLATLPAEDPSVDADVRIFWDEGQKTTSESITALSQESPSAADIVPPPPPDMIVPSKDGYEVLLIDDFDKPKVNVKVKFVVDGTTTVIPTDTKGRAFLPVQGTSASLADVAILMDNDPLANADTDPDAIAITIVDENEKPVQGAEAIFTIGGKDHTVYSDNNGVAALKHSDADEAIVTIKKSTTPPVNAATDMRSH